MNQPTQAVAAVLYGLPFVWVGIRFVNAGHSADRSAVFGLARVLGRMDRIAVGIGIMCPRPAASAPR